jgi:hypothetical protein
MSDNTSFQHQEVDSGEGYKQIVAMVEDCIKTAETKRWLFISESKGGKVFSCPFAGEKELVDSESDMVAEYLLHIAQREGKDPEDVMRTVVEKMNNGGITKKDD